MTTEQKRLIRFYECQIERLLCQSESIGEAYDMANVIRRASLLAHIERYEQKIALVSTGLVDEVQS